MGALMTTMQFLDAVRNLLDGATMREAEALAERTPEPRRLAAEFVQRGWLTQGQVDGLLADSNGHITAEEPRPRPGLDTRERRYRDPDARPSSSGGGGLILIAVIVGLLVCLPAVGFVIFAGLGMAWVVPIADQRDIAPMAIDAVADVAMKAEMPDGALANGPLVRPNIEVLHRFDGDTFRLSMDGTRVAHCKGDKCAVSEIATGKKIFNLPDGRFPLGFTRDKWPEVATGSTGDSMQVFLTDAETGQELKICPAVRGPIDMVRMMHEGEGALILRGQELIVYNFAAAKEAPVHLTLPDGVTDIAIGKDNDSFVVGWGNGKVQLWSLKKQAKVHDYPGAIFGITAVAISPDGKRVLAGCEKSILLWDRDDPNKRANFDLDDAVLCAAFSPDGKKIISGGTAGLVCLSDAATGAMLGHFRHGFAMTAIAFHPDGERAITASSDNVVRLWKLPK
jgi:hypothetical protein